MKRKLTMTERIARNIKIAGAVEASRDENGKIDRAKAAGLTMGMGYRSAQDIAILLAMTEEEEE